MAGLANTGWPNWGNGYCNRRRTTIVARTDLQTVFVATYTGINNCGGPAFDSDGNMYVCASGLLSLNPDGGYRWRTSPYNDDSLYMTPPVLDDNTIVFPARNTKKTRRITQAGADVWSYTTTYYFQRGITTGPDGAVYVSTNKLMALNPNGTLRWYGPSDSGNLFYGYPTFTKNMDRIVCMTMLEFRAFDLAGNLVWSYPHTAAACEGGNIFVLSDGTLVGGNEDGKIFALWPDGTLRWVYNTGGHANVGAIGWNDEIFYSWHSRSYAYIGALDSDGHVLWENPGYNDIRVGAIVDGKNRVIWGNINDVSTGTYNVRIYESDGTLVNSVTVPRGLYLSPSIDQYGRIYVPTGTKGLYCLGQVPASGGGGQYPRPARVQGRYMGVVR